MTEHGSKKGWVQKKKNELATSKQFKKVNYVKELNKSIRASKIVQQANFGRYSSVLVYMASMLQALSPVSNASKNKDPTTIKLKR